MQHNTSFYNFDVQAEAAEKEPHPRSHRDVAELERKENAHGTRGSKIFLDKTEG